VGAGGRMLLKAIDRPLSRALAAYWFAGFIISEIAGILAFRRIGSSGSIPFVIPAIVLFVLGFLTFWRNSWALAVSTLLSAAQIAGTVGCIVELHAGIDAMKATELHALGIDPAVGVVLNLIYSIAGAALFAWIAARFILVRKTAARPSGKL
jgi:hypothetical protein